MLEPSTVARELTGEFNAVETTYETTEGREKRYVYTVEAEDFLSTVAIFSRLSNVEENTETSLRFCGVEPAVNVGDSSIEARVALTFEEGVDRNEVENKSLQDFEDQKV